MDTTNALIWCRVRFPRCSKRYQIIHVRHFAWTVHSLLLSSVKASEFFPYSVKEVVARHVRSQAQHQNLKISLSSSSLLLALALSPSLHSIRFPGGPDGFLRKRILPFRRLAKSPSSFCWKVSSPSAISVNFLALPPFFSSRLTSSSSRPVSFSPNCWTSCL